MLEKSLDVLVNMVDGDARYFLNLIESHFQGLFFQCYFQQRFVQESTKTKLKV